MPVKNLPIAGLSLAAAVAGSGTVVEAQAAPDLVERLKSQNDEIRGDAWQQAGPAGAAAIGPVSTLWTDTDFEVARSAKRAVWQIVHYAGRPGAAPEARAVEAALIPMLKHPAAAVRREAALMLSEIGGNDSIEALAQLLSDPEVRDDARCALERLPGSRSTKALRGALKTAPEEFRYALAESLRKRGEKVEGYTSRKMVPTRT